MKLSACMHAWIGFDSFFLGCHQSESKHCYDVLRKSWDVLDDALATKEGQAQLRRTFTMCK